MDGFLNDVRLGLRQVRRRPTFTVVAAFSLAIGVGANTAIFTAGSALLLRPVSGVHDPDRVVELGRTTRGAGFDTFAYPDFLDLRDGVPALSRLAAYAFGTFSFAASDGGERIAGIHVSESYFDALGLRPALGRVFTAEEAAPGAPGTVAVLDHGFWSERLGAAPNVVGSTVRLNRVAFTVVGVLPEAFRGHATGFRPAVYLPLRSSPLLSERADVWEARNSSWHMVLGRLAEGATLEQAREQVERVYERLAAEYPETNTNRGGTVVRLGPVPGAGRTQVGYFIAVLMALVGLILVVTCVNVAGMFLARASAREREIAVRLAIGAGRGRLVRQLLAEALVVFAIGGGLGVVVGAWGIGLLPFDRLPLPIDVHIDLSADARVLAYGVAATLSTGLLFGLVPALGATRLDVAPSLRDATDVVGRAGLLRRFFVSSQVGFSLVLLVAAGLLLRSLQRAAAVDAGFDPEGAWVTTVDLSLEGYDEETGPRMQDRLLEVVSAVPGVESAALAIDLPLDLGAHGTAVYPEGWSGPDGREGLGVEFNHVSPEYFAALGIDVRQGRAFTPSDRPDTEPVTIVSRSLADAVWPGERALGRSVRVFGSDATPRTVVGVVDDVKNQLITDEPEPFVYLPLAQLYRPATNVVARARPGARQEVSRELRGAILSADPSLSVPPVTSLQEYTSLGILPQRVAASITSVLGVFALLLSGLGVYGVVAYGVTRRTREIGVRMALGEGRRSVMQRVILGGVWMTLPGIALGAAGALAIGRVMRFLLLGLHPLDPIALGAVAGGLLVVVVVASAMPARRASAIEPVEALRAE